MPLVFEKALKTFREISDCALLTELEIQGFAKAFDRKDVGASALVDSLAKQYDDFRKAKSYEDKLEALADLRNVAGLLFLALEGGERLG